MRVSRDSALQTAGFPAKMVVRPKWRLEQEKEAFRNQWHTPACPGPVNMDLVVEVLVVDDSPVDRRLVGGLLERQSYLTVGYASDGADALDQIARRDIERPRSRSLLHGRRDTRNADESLGPRPTRGPPHRR